MNEKLVKKSQEAQSINQELGEAIAVERKEVQRNQPLHEELTMSSTVPLTIPPEGAMPSSQWHQHQLQHQHHSHHPLPPNPQQTPAVASSPPTVGPYHYPMYHQPFPYPGYHPYPPPPPHPSHLPSPPPSIYMPPPHYPNPNNSNPSQEAKQLGNQSTTSPVPPTSVPYQYPYYGHYPYYSPPPPPHSYYGVAYQHPYTTSHQENLQDSNHPVQNSQTVIENRHSGKTTNPENSMEDEKIRQERNIQARKKEKELKNRIKMIAAKKDKTKEEIQLCNAFEERRRRKNKRSRERTKEKKEEMNKLLAKPKEDLTEKEKSWLDFHLKAKKRKNEGDRLRRERLKSLGISSSRSSVTSAQSEYEDLSYSYSDQVAYASTSSRGAVPTTIHTSALNTQENLPSTQIRQQGQHGERNQQHVVEPRQNIPIVGSQHQKELSNVSERRSHTSTSRALSPNILDQLANVMESPTRGGSELIDPTSFFTSLTPTPPVTEAISLQIPSFGQQQQQQQQQQGTEGFERPSMSRRRVSMLQSGGKQDTNKSDAPTKKSG
jgi:hypothetical protein